MPFVQSILAGKEEPKLRQEDFQLSKGAAEMGFAEKAEQSA